MAAIDAHSCQRQPSLAPALHLLTDDGVHGGALFALKLQKRGAHGQWPTPSMRRVARRTSGKLLNLFTLWKENAPDIEFVETFVEAYLNDFLEFWVR